MSHLPTRRTVIAALPLTAALFTGNNAIAKPADEFIVHEWGTFSTFSGSDGKLLKFLPNDTDLPPFVYNRRSYVKGGLTDSLVSLETPVLYFYSEKDRKVSVQVDFPQGTMTDWYPEASRPPSQQLRWDDVQVLSQKKPSLIGDPGRRGEGTMIRGRYFEARQTDAQYLQITKANTADQLEYEKFIFYRGVGDFTMPYEVKARGKGIFTVKNTGKHAVLGQYLIQIQDKNVTFQSLGQLAPNTEKTVELPHETSTLEKLADAVTKSLIEQGLYEKEAIAMVKTWSSDWFGENGTRVLYLVAEPLTEELLPLKITPKPDKQIRVLVGRHDVLTPEREREIELLVNRLHGDSNSDAKTADTLLNKMGRYRTAAQSAAEKRIKESTARRVGR